MSVATNPRARSARVAASLLAAIAVAACAGTPETYTPGVMTKEQIARCREVAQAYFDRKPEYQAMRDELREDELASKWFVRYLIHGIVTMREGQSVLLSEEKVRLDKIRRQRKAPPRFDLPGQRDDLRAIHQIVAMGEPAVEVVIEDLLKDRQEFLRTIGVEILAGVGDAAVPNLLALAKGGDARQQGQAARALGAIGARGPALAALRELAGSPEWRVRSDAAQALGTGGVEARTLLIAMLQDGDPFVQRKAAETLASYPDAIAAGALVDFLESCKERNEWNGELAAQNALQQIAGSKGPRTAQAWRHFVEQLREGGDQAQHGR
ncbi:MAG: HEAT repeat domain-containing protein [Planctomycetota bacterium]